MDTQIPTILKKSDLSKKIGLALVPFTPVPLTGPDAVLGIGRIALYGIVTYATWSKMRPVSYISAGAIAVSLFSSLTGKAWKNAEDQET